MACFHPMTGYRARERNPATGKRRIVFNSRDGFIDQPVTIPCGQCVGCRLERSRQWAIRCVHEASLHERNCFITLTYDNAHLPKSGSLELDAFQKFMKRLRKRFGDGIRFFHCGEYGEKFKRPHYHACLFNFDFEDRELWKQRDGVNLYISESLSELWPFGFSTIGDVTFESAAYVARYIMKKVTGDKAVEHYAELGSFGEILAERRPEYVTMSRRPGIGKPWLEKFRSDVYPSDFVLMNGKKMRPPKYYDSIFELEDPEMCAKVKARRKSKAEEHSENNTPDRLAVREEIQLRKANQLVRGYENETKSLRGL